MANYIQIFTDFFSTIKERSDYLIPYLDRRASCERWLQGEFIHYLYELKKNKVIIDATIEKNYGQRMGLCDIWFQVADKEIWCELQVIVTNYGRPGKPITNQIRHIIEDGKKLRKCPIQMAEKLLMFMAYPIPKDKSSRQAWEDNHMARINDVAQNLIDPLIFSLNDKYEARIYLANIL